MLKEVTILILLLVCSVNAATIKGAIYDSDLNLLKNAIVKINTFPEQQYIAKEGTYLFEVGEGSYILKATLKQNNILFSSYEQNITINDEGTYNLDLILHLNCASGASNINLAIL